MKSFKQMPKEIITQQATDSTFGIQMHRCPSKGRLLENEQIEPYRDYCEHCDVLYRRVLEPLGFRSFTDRECPLSPHSETTGYGYQRKAQKK